MQQPCAALILVIFIFVSNSFAEDKNDGINRNPIFSKDILNMTETNDVTQFIDQIINKLNDNPISRDREETFILDGKVGNVKVENQQLGKGKYKIIINKKQIKNKPKKSIRTYKIKVKTKARVQPKKITFETNTKNGADINNIISKFISEEEISKNVNSDTHHTNLNVATSDNVKALRDSEQLRETLIQFIHNIQAHSGSKIDGNDNLDKLLSYLWTIIKSKPDASPPENHENLAVIALNNDKDTQNEVSQQSSGNVGFDAIHGQQTTFHLPYQTTNQKVQNLKQNNDLSFKTDDIQALINILTQQNGNVNNLFNVESLTPLDKPKPSEKDQFEFIKELGNVKGVSKQENPNLDDSHVQGLVSKLCDAAKTNVIEFWDLLLRYLRSNNIGDKIETNKKLPFNEIIKEILKENNKDLKKHDQVDSDFVEKIREHKDQQSKYLTIEKTTTTTDATVEIHNKPILTPSEKLARYGDLINNPTGNGLITLEKNKSLTIPEYEIELTTQSSVIQLHPESDNNTLKYQEEDLNPNLLLLNENVKYEQDEPNISENNENNTLERKKPNWILPSTDNLIDHINDTEPHEHHVEEIDKEPHPSDHANELLYTSYDVHKNDNIQHPSDHVNENDRQPHLSDHINKNVKVTPPSNYVNENDIVPSQSEQLDENAKEKTPSSNVNGNYTKPLPSYYVVEHDKHPNPSYNVNENDIVSYPSDFNENVKETPPLDHVNSNYTEPLPPFYVKHPSNHINENDILPPPYDHHNENFKDTPSSNHVNHSYTNLLPPYVIDHDEVPYPTNNVNVNGIISYISDHLNENVKETPSSNHDNGNYTEPLSPHYVNEHDKPPHPSIHFNENDIAPSASDHINKESPPSNHVNVNHTESLIPYYVIEHNNLLYPYNHVSENDKETPPSDLVNENNKNPFLLNYFIEHTKLPPLSNHVNGHIVHETDSKEKEPGTEETSEEKTQVVDRVALSNSFNYELDSISTESPEFSEEISLPAKESLVNKYPLNHKTILQYLNPHGKIKNDGSKDDEEYIKFIYGLPVPLLQSLLLSIDQELNADPSKPKVNPDTYILLNKLLQMNLSPQVSNYNKNVHSVVNKHTHPDFYIILNKLIDLSKKKNKKPQTKINMNPVPDDQTFPEKFPVFNKNKSSSETLTHLIEYLKSSLPDDPSDCRVQSYNEILEKIIHFFD